jgi:chromosome segregation ATPase
MARDTKEQREIKIKAVYEAIKVLKDESTPTNNQLTYDKVVSMANELYSDKLNRKISPTSIKSPTSKEFEDIKEVIVDYREEHKKIKSAAPKKTVKEVAKLKKQIENLVTEVAKFYDYKLLLNEKLEAKENTINKLKAERKKLNAEIDRLRG